MSLRIGYDGGAAQAHAALESSSAAVAQSIARLSSGLRINSASDDAAGLGISVTMQSQISGIDQANRNIQDGISMMQTLDGALSEAQSILQRARTLAVQWDNGTLSFEQSEDIQAEWTQLSNQLGVISESTQFNGIALLQSNTAQITLQIGANDGEVVLVTLADLMGPTSGALVHPSEFFAFPGDPADIPGLDESINDISNVRARIGGTVERLQSSLAFNTENQENLMGANSRIEDVDVAQETVNLTRAQILQQSSTAMLGDANFLDSQSVLYLLNAAPNGSDLYGGNSGGGSSFSLSA